MYAHRTFNIKSSQSKPVQQHKTFKQVFPQTFSPFYILDCSKDTMLYCNFLSLHFKMFNNSIWKKIAGVLLLCWGCFSQYISQRSMVFAKPFNPLPKKAVTVYLFFFFLNPAKHFKSIVIEDKVNLCKDNLLCYIEFEYP